ncbi:hypothetical protein M3175_01385 [Robertmurraya korlensis]|uniref:hypothetical protein n=1 Tax=Robertmurraya korlensis TaxID=519977 RepID=UPI00203B188E|nr:hypothetical protein [Robertmurraya korlensis]MCM3599367.1 hypothetical protein [Robertmurraya korlensis]
MNLKKLQAQAAWEQLQIVKVLKAEEEKKLAQDFVRELQRVLHEKNVRIEQLEDQLKKATAPINITINLPSN